MGNREWGIVGMGNDKARGSDGEKKGGGVRCGEVFLPDSPFPIADSQGKGGGAWGVLIDTACASSNLCPLYELQ